MYRQYTPVPQAPRGPSPLGPAAPSAQHAQDAQETSRVSKTPDLDDLADAADMGDMHGGREGCLRAMLRLSGTQHFCIVRFWDAWHRLSMRQQTRVWYLVHELYLNDQEALRAYVLSFM